VLLLLVVADRILEAVVVSGDGVLRLQLETRNRRSSINMVVVVVVVVGVVVVVVVVAMVSDDATSGC
jgi:hypothetical protein